MKKSLFILSSAINDAVQLSVWNKDFHRHVDSVRLPPLRPRGVIRMITIITSWVPSHWSEKGKKMYDISDNYANIIRIAPMCQGDDRCILVCFRLKFILILTKFWLLNECLLQISNFHSITINKNCYLYSVPEFTINIGMSINMSSPRLAFIAMMITRILENVFF